MDPAMVDRPAHLEDVGPLELSATDTPQKIQPSPVSHLRTNSPVAAPSPSTDEIRRQLTRLEGKLDEVLALLKRSDP